MREKLNLIEMLLDKSLPVVYLLCQIFIIVPVFAESSHGDRNASLDVDGYKYEYQSIPVLHPTSKKLMFYTGRIAISGIENHQIIYEENATLQPGCDDFPSISKLLFKVPISRLLGGDPKKDRTLTVLCGSSSGRHPTIKIFFYGPVGLRVAALDFENSQPNIIATKGEGIYESVVYRQVLFGGDDGIGRTPYIFAYALNVDSSTFGFSPQFGQGVASKYFDYYKRLSNSSKTAISPDYIGPMISALFATKDKDNICREISVMASRGVKPADMRDWAIKLPNAGYPYFELNICEVK